MNYRSSTDFLNVAVTRVLLRFDRPSYYSFKRKFMLASNNGIIMVNRTCVSLKATM